MGQDDTAGAAFAVPEAAAGALGQRPLDLAHLEAQTMGDRDLEREVLGLFLRGAGDILHEIGESKGKEAAFLAHKLKGSAKAVGAFALSRLAEAIEKAPDDPASRAAVRHEFVRIEAFVASIQR